MTTHPIVSINYRRPPNHVQVFEQYLVLDDPDVKVTFVEAMPYEPPMRIEGEVVLELGSDVVWFTFPGAWHDIGRFHRADGTFTGLYANILTPAEIRGYEWDTTDLFLDVWMSPGGRVLLLDEEELDEAVGREWINAETAARARAEGQRILHDAATGAWPPPVVFEWTLERCRSVLGR